MVFGAVVLLGWTLFGGLDALNVAVREGVAPRFGALAYEVALFAAFVAIGAVLDAPFAWYSTFRLEQRFGFNRVTWRLWLADTLKGIALAVVVGVPLLAGVLWIMAAAGTAWWLWAWAAWLVIVVVAQVVVPSVIAPLFNRFEKLQDASLQSRVQALMARAGFAAKGLFVMDGSRRSAHANAYFTGFGAAKRVVFFDTLLARLGAGEVEAVLAHELGHFKLHHIRRRMVTMALFSLAFFALLGWLVDAAVVLRRPRRHAEPHPARRRARAAAAAARQPAVRRLRRAASSPAGRAATSSRPTPSPRSMPTAASSLRRC